MLTFDNVRFQYDSEDFSIIDHLSFTVDAGEFVCVIGPSGCGKSTIFRLVNKLLTPAEGTVLVNGTPIEKQKNYCGYMPQQDLLFPWRTVKENLMLPMGIILWGISFPSLLIQPIPVPDLPAAPSPLY